MTIYHKSLHILKRLICTNRNDFDSDLLFEVSKMFLNGLSGPHNEPLGKVLILIANEFNSSSAESFIAGNPYLFDEGLKREANFFTKQIMATNLDCNFMLWHYNIITSSGYSFLPSLEFTGIESMFLGSY